MSSSKLCRQAILSAPNEKAIRIALLNCVTEMRTEIAMLPLECQEALAERDADLNTLAMTLLHADMAFKGDPAVGAVLRQMADVFATASVRVTQLYSPAPSGQIDGKHPHA